VTGLQILPSVMLKDNKNQINIIGKIVLIPFLFSVLMSEICVRIVLAQSTAANQSTNLKIVLLQQTK